MDFGDEATPQVTHRGSATDNGEANANGTGQTESEHLRVAQDANPELREALQEASAYRETSATPEEAGTASAKLGDLNPLDDLFFPRRPEHDSGFRKSRTACAKTFR